METGVGQNVTGRYVTGQNVNRTKSHMTKCHTDKMSHGQNVTEKIRMGKVGILKHLSNFLPLKTLV